MTTLINELTAAPPGDELAWMRMNHEDNFKGIIGRSATITVLCKQVKIVATTGSTVLVLGETGTGKELIARDPQSESAPRPSLHQNQLRRDSGRID